MSLKEPKFLVLNTDAQWKGGHLETGNIRIDSGLSLLPKRSYVHDGTVPYPYGLNPDDVAMDRCGNFFLLSSGQIHLFDKDRSTFHTVKGLSWLLPERIACSDTDLFIASQEKLVCLSRANYQVRWEQPLPVPGHELAGMTYQANAFYFLNKSGKLFQWKRVKGDLIGFEIGELLIRDANDEKFSLATPIDIASDGQNLYILCRDQGIFRILKLMNNGAIVDSFVLPLPTDFTPAAMAMSSSDRFFISGVDKMIIIQAENHFDPNGTYTTPVLDSTINGCQWHRIILEAGTVDAEGLELPASAEVNTRIKVSLSASDDHDELSSWSPLPDNPADALISEARGRYIRFRIELFSDDLKQYSPLIKSLKVEFPHHSYLRYLPAVYQENETGKAFLSRFLPLFESFFDEMEKSIFSLPRYFDAEGAPDEYIPWLSQWIALSQDENWPQERLRKLIREAPRLYKMRGTRRGIEEIISIYLGDEATLVLENFQMKCGSDPAEERSVKGVSDCKDRTVLIVDNVHPFKEEDLVRVKGEDTVHYGIVSEIKKDPDGQGGLVLRGRLCHEGLLAEKDQLSVARVRPEAFLTKDTPFGFCVLLKPRRVSADQLHTVQRIVDREKPAHTAGCVMELEPLMYLDGPTFLEINTYLSKRTFALEESILSKDTVLTDYENSGQLEVRSGIGIDSRLT